MIRTVEPFDWLKLVRSWWPDAVQVHEGDKVYYKVHCPALGPNSCFYFPDNRTVVCGADRMIVHFIRRQAPSAPVFACGDDWKSVEHDLLAVILDNHDSRISRVTKECPKDEEEAQFDGLLELSNRWVMGLADADDFMVRFIASCRDPHSTQTIAKLIANLRDYYLKDLHKCPRGTIPDHLRVHVLADHILKNLRVDPGQTIVRVEPGRGVKLAELLSLIAKNGL